MKLIAVNTEEKCDALMREIEAKGIKFGDGSTTEFDCWIIHGSDTVISVAYGSIGYGARKYYEKEYPDIEIIDYEIKKFKVGDRVRHKEFEWEAVVKYVYDNGSFGINDAPFFYYPESCELVEPPQKPTVPKSFDKWYKVQETHEENTILMLGYDYLGAHLNDELSDWIANNKETAIQAILNGYEVEEEPLYYVKLPGCAEEECYLNKWRNDNRLEVNNKEDNRVMQTQFTESEIKAIDPWYFEKAVRVEEDE